jgi:hypothetical protein
MKRVDQIFRIAATIVLAILLAFVAVHLWRGG